MAPALEQRVFWEHRSHSRWAARFLAGKSRGRVPLPWQRTGCLSFCVAGGGGGQRVLVGVGHTRAEERVIPRGGNRQVPDRGSTPAAFCSESLGALIALTPRSACFPQGKEAAIRWLSCGKVLSRSFRLREEIDSFLTEKNRPEPLLSNTDWHLEIGIFCRLDRPYESIEFEVAR
ncbi:hypothetical protein NDU88_004931 [Pleurodeles waltl]|uniref:Uncharacterized protein n=1 Tax=Pleurodeles waltl TaxID=8319 RepID=A0AAV7VL84_PLEWA|nr:hypothetical protein NDU88_004931 [Pleurodeles waltl]